MTLAVALGGALRQVPVDPDAETARRWLETELADPVYHQRESLLVQAIRWVLEQLQDVRVTAAGFDPRFAALAIAVTALVIGAVALLITGPVRRNRRAGRSVEVLGEDTRSAQELRASADALAAGGRFSSAVLDRFRAILRSLEERALLEERPGRTAHEAVLEAGGLFPEEQSVLRRGGDLFDDVCYGEAEATADDDAFLRALDARLLATRRATTETADRPDSVRVEAT